MKALRVLRLNLDFEGDHQAYCGNADRRRIWYATLTRKKGPEIAHVMQACPLLEHVDLLYHGQPSSIWIEFHPPQIGRLEIVVKYDSDHVYVLLKISFCRPSLSC